MWIIIIYESKIRRNTIPILRLSFIKILEIKNAAKAGNTEAAKILAKQLHQMRKAKTRTYAAKSKVQTIGTSAKLMQANAKMGEVLGSTTKAMGEMNKLVNPAQMNKTMQEFAKQSMQMGMTDEMSNFFPNNTSETNTMHNLWKLIETKMFFFQLMTL